MSQYSTKPPPSGFPVDQLLVQPAQASGERAWFAFTDSATVDFSHWGHAGECAGDECLFGAVGLHHREIALEHGYARGLADIDDVAPGDAVEAVVAA